MKAPFINKTTTTSSTNNIHAVIYIIGDNYAEKQQLRKFLLENKSQHQHLQHVQQNCLNVYYSNVLGMERMIEVYDFPSDRFVRQYLDLYFQILPKPNLILYCADLQSSHKEIQQWIHLIQDQQQSIVFISDIQSLSQKSQLIKKISYFFQKQVIDYIYLPQLDKNSLYTCICNLDQGISLKNYIRKVNTWKGFKTLIKRLAQFFKNNKQTTSVV